jgi:hypothetical protein
MSGTRTFPAVLDSAYQVTVSGPRHPRTGEHGTERIALADAWLVWSYEHNAWWGPEWAGYTTNVLRAGLYTQAAATQIEQLRGTGGEEARHVSAVLRGVEFSRDGTFGGALLGAARRNLELAG